MNLEKDGGVVGVGGVVVFHFFIFFSFFSFFLSSFFLSSFFLSSFLFFGKNTKTKNQVSSLVAPNFFLKVILIQGSWCKFSGSGVIFLILYGIAIQYFSFIWRPHTFVLTIFFVFFFSFFHFFFLSLFLFTFFCCIFRQFYLIFFKIRACTPIKSSSSLIFHRRND